MKTSLHYSNLPALIGHVTSGIAESVNSSWAVAMSTFADGLFPLAVVGSHPSIESCVRDIGNVVWRERQAHGLSAMDPLEFDGANRPGYAPRIVCPLTVGSTTCLLAFGPRKDGREYSASDRALLAALTAPISEPVDDTPGQPEQPSVQGIDYFAAQPRIPQHSGDFLDLLSLEESSLLVSLGSASRNNAEPAESSASVIMAGVVASLRALARATSATVSTLVCELNRIVRELAPRSFFADIFLGNFDVARHQLHYVNAGFQPPLLIKANRIRAARLEANAAVLGLTDLTPCWHRTLPLQPGDVFVALPDDSPVASERVALEVVLSHRDASSLELAGLIGHRIGYPAARAEQTVVVVRATQPQPSFQLAA